MNPRNNDSQFASLFELATKDAKTALRDVTFDMAGLQSLFVGFENKLTRPTSLNELPKPGKRFTVEWKEDGSDVTRVVRSFEPMTIIVPAARPIKIVFTGDDVTIDQ